MSVAIALNAASTCSPASQQLRERLGLEGLLPHPRLVEPGEEVVEIPDRELCEPRLVRGTRPSVDDGSSLGGAAGGEEEGDVASDVQKTDGHRERVAPSVRESVPVPAGEDVLEGGLDARAEVEPPREPLRHLAHRRERLSGPRAGVGDRVLDHRGANLRGAARADVGAVEREHLRRIRRVDQEERGSVLDVVSEQLGCLVAVRRTPRGVKQCDVVRVDELPRRDAGELPEADGEHCGTHGVLERLPRAQIRRQREGADHLGCPDRRLARRPHSYCPVEILRVHVQILGRGRLATPLTLCFYA